MTKDDVIETLAAIEHQRWADWQKYLHSEGFWHPVPFRGEEHLAIPKECIDRWERQIVQPYAQLSEAEKESDRAQVDRYWPVIVEFVAEWMASFVHDGFFTTEQVDAWREEMT